jgi:hypothetical protein
MLFLFPHLFPKTRFMSQNMHSTVDNRHSTVNTQQSAVNSPYKRQHHKHHSRQCFALLFFQERSSCPTTCIRQSTVDTQQSTVLTSDNTITDHALPSCFSQTEVHVPQHAFDSRQPALNTRQSIILTSDSTITDLAFPSYFSKNEVHVPEHAFDSRQSTLNSRQSSQAIAP